MSVLPSNHDFWSCYHFVSLKVLFSIFNVLEVYLYDDCVIFCSSNDCLMGSVS